MVSGNAKSGEALVQLLKSYAYAKIDTASSAAQARRKLNVSVYDLILINTPLQDEQGQVFAAAAAKAVESGIILLVKNEILAPIAAKAEGEGIFVLPKPCLLYTSRCV